MKSSWKRLEELLLTSQVEKILQSVARLIHNSLEKTHNAQIAKVIQEFQDDGVEKRANLSQQYLGAQNIPLGEDPLLVTGMRLSYADSHFLISFQLENNKTLNTKLSKCLGCLII